MASFDDYGLTKNGYVVPTEDEISALILSLCEGLGIPTDQEQYSVKEAFYTTTGGITERNYLNEAYKIKQSTVLTATGEALDELVVLFLTRLKAQQSYVYLTLTGDNNTSIDTGTQVKNPSTNDIFSNVTNYTITNTSSTKVILSISDVTAGYYSITINSIITSTKVTQEQIDAGLTMSQLLTIFATNININSDLKDKVVAIVENDKLIISSISELDVYPYEVSEQFTYEKVTSVGIFYAEEEGEIEVAKNTINTIVTIINGLDSVNNPTAGSVGRELETDSEFRTRYLQTNGDTSKFATNQAIKKAILAVSGVTFADADDNKIKVYSEIYGEMTVINGIKCVAIGGDDNEVAQAIFDKKSGGVSTFGTSQGTAKDTNGAKHIIYFTRPTQKYVFISITIYNTHDATITEDDKYPELAKNAIISSDYVTNHKIGQEVTPVYIESAVCQALTEKIGKVVTKVAVKDSPTDIPQDTDYQTTEIIISESEIAVFSSSRITVDVVNNSNTDI